jgi:hypothetical protein
MIKEKRFNYNKLKLDSNIDYLINQEKSGYFQSYKYFWHNISKLKEYIYIDNDKITKCKNYLKNFDKYIAIHIRLTDYKIHSEYHYNLDIEYYIKILLKYKNYKILLFSDDVNLAYTMLIQYINKENIIYANEFSEDDEEQFYLLSCSKIRICANSTFSLWSCYFNEIYNFDSDALYYFPSQWFGEKGPNCNIYNLIPIKNPKFKIIKYSTLSINIL